MRYISNATALPCGALGTSLVVLLTSSTASFAQDAGGLNLTFDLGQRFENVQERGFATGDEDSFRSLTTFGFALDSETRSQRLAIAVTSAFAAEFDDGGDSGFESGTAAVEYARSSRNSELSFGARYRRDNVDDLVFDATLADDDIVTGVGEREVVTYTTGLVFGRASRVTGTFNYTYETSAFFDIVDPTLNDSDTQAADARLSFQLSPVLTADLFAAWGETDEQGAGATDREAEAYGTSLTYRIDPITTLGAEVSYSEEESRDPAVTRTEGVNYALSLTRERPNGGVSLAYTQDDALTGTRRQLVAGQSIDLQRGAFEYSLGVSETEGFDVQFLANLALDYQTDKNGTASILLSQEGTINGDDEEVVNSRLSLAYSRALTEISTLGASLDYVDEDVLDAAGLDQQSLRFDVTYDHALGEDWGLTSGYEYSVVQVDGSDDRTRSTVFVGLEKRFAYRP